MKVLGIYGSPRKCGNSDILLDEALKGAESAGADVSTVYCSDVTVSGCLECGGCDETGECVVDDDMQSIYPKLVEADVIFLSTPIFFYGPTAQAKAVIDRSQALWCRRMLEKKPEDHKKYASGRGYLIAVGATKGANLFEGIQLVAKYFYDALDMSYEGGLFVRSVEKKGDINNFPEYLKQAFDLGVTAVSSGRRADRD
ncbi:flavodoxin family protein [Desulfomonile tiedjei]|uniref:Multimeric flavodoxin WrbA n=1 Tax=Desulfomonile tiedjei (strain ATCC 49306 / DSM 6799 / DCB-1) TaxID=706587 RepID=I4CBH7_DESTA|nr:flavodoxin family protein [Desulfomonile tiedjei]AFM26918.1 multimeric flavodoxin WrbA [Desulfomonile tiedjei DSM 6799]